MVIKSLGNLTQKFCSIPKNHHFFVFTQWSQWLSNRTRFSCSVFGPLLGLFHDVLHPEVQSSHTLVHDGGFLSKMMVEKWDFYVFFLKFIGFVWDLDGFSWIFLWDCMGIYADLGWFNGDLIGRQGIHWSRWWYDGRFPTIMEHRCLTCGFLTLSSGHSIEKIMMKYNQGSITSNDLWIFNIAMV